MAVEQRTELKFEPTFPEFLQLQKLIARQLLPTGNRRSLRILLVLGVGFVIGVLASELMDWLRVGRAAGGNAFFVGFVSASLLMFVLQLTGYRRNMRRAFELSGPADYSAAYDSSVLVSRVSGIEVVAPWHSLTGAWTANSTTYVLFGVGGAVLPDRAFGSQEQRDAFREIVARHTKVVTI